MAANHLEEGVDVTSGARVLECVVVTPEETTLQTPAQFIALPLFDGEIGIAPGRAPMIGRLGFGEMRIREGNHVYRYYVDGGFVEVSGNRSDSGNRFAQRSARSAADTASLYHSPCKSSVFLAETTNHLSEASS